MSSEITRNPENWKKYVEAVGLEEKSGGNVLEALSKHPKEVLPELDEKEAEDLNAKIQQAEAAYYD